MIALIEGGSHCEPLFVMNVRGDIKEGDDLFHPLINEQYRVIEISIPDDESEYDVILNCEFIK